MWPFTKAAQARRPHSIPLFPLKTVLFPGGLLPLKIFEQRYIEMAKACMKDEQPFGVCLITQGEEVASGSNPADAMAVCPCSMGMLAAIAHGLADNLIERAADVMLKERRPLVLVPRETPLSVIHLDNMLKVAQAGAVILPPTPGFYTHPQTIADLVDFVVARVLDQLRVPHDLVARWGGTDVNPSIRGSGSA